MKRETLFLKLAVIILGVPVLALCIFGLPAIAREASTHFPAYVVYSFLAGMYGSAVPFYIALYQALKLLHYIDGNNAFSDLSVQALKKIKYCGITISILQWAGLPLLYNIAQKEDAPGVMLLGLIISFASMVIAVFAAVLQKLLKNAIAIKSENDLTV